MAEDKKDQKLQVFERPLRYEGAEHVVAIFADQAMVSHSTGNFTLAFYQVLVPETDSPETLQKIEAIPARCVSRIVLAPGLVQSLYEAIGKNIETQKTMLMELGKTRPNEKSNEKDS